MAAVVVADASGPGVEQAAIGHSPNSYLMPNDEDSSSATCVSGNRESSASHKAMRRTLTLGLAIVLSCEACLVGGREQENLSVESLGKALAEAKTLPERRTLWFRAIDEGLISYQAPRTLVDQVFGFHGDRHKRWVDLWPEAPPPRGGSSRWIVDLNDAPAEQGAKRPPDWFLFVAWDAMGLQYEFGDREAQRLETGYEVWRPGPDPPQRYQWDEKAAPAKEEQGAPIEPEYQELRRAYMLAKTQYERREIAVRAIDEGLIRAGGETRAVDAILWTNCRRAADRITGTRVYFLPLHRVELEGGTFKAGWYLDVAYDPAGRIVGYWLSNLHELKDNY